MKSQTMGTIGLVLCLMLGFAPSPAANAAFTGSATETASFSTAKLEAPAKHRTQVTISCAVVSATITVKNYGTVAHANHHEVIIYSGEGTTPVFIGDLNKKSGQTYTTMSLLTGAWRVEIRGKYLLGDTGKGWTGPALSQTVTC